MTIKSIIQTTAIFICYVFIIGCSEDKPKDVLSQEQMTSFILDIYEGEGKITVLGVPRDSALTLFEAYEEKVFEKHGIAKERYTKSLSWYFDHPSELEVIYDNVLDSLNVTEQEIKKEEEMLKQNKEEDSKADQKR